MGESVTIYDNFSRRGVNRNFSWLRHRYGDRVHLVVADIRDLASLSEVVKKTTVIYHLAAQVAVTSSLENPIQDFEINVRGTLNLLESIRRLRKPPVLVFTSTNKVYGELSDILLNSHSSRFVPQNASIRQRGIAVRQLAFHSPYGCSKGAADQYTRDYYRIYGLPTVVFRQSAIYGYRQFGVEDQGWLAWFIIAAVLGKPITIYGDGKQVRDMLFIDDLLDAYDAATARIDRVAGQVYNIGGGARNTISVWTEFAPMLEKLLGRKLPVQYGDWRPGDQRVIEMHAAQLPKELHTVPIHPCDCFAGWPMLCFGVAIYRIQVRISLQYVGVVAIHEGGDESIGKAAAKG